MKSPQYYQRFQRRVTQINTMEHEQQEKPFAEQPPKTKWRLYEKIALGAGIMLFLLVFYISLDANKYRATVRVVEGSGRVGVNPTDEALDFGDLSRGTSAVRRVHIQNGTPIPMYIAHFRLGSISGLMNADKNFFTVAPHAEERIEYSLYMPASAEIERTYDGRVYLFKIPKPW
jgi:hypothetical protein